jgi:hypothetical protein
MAQTRKTFKIGEYAVGGKVYVQINGKVIQIQFRDWNTDEVIHKGSVLSSQDSSERQIRNFLEDYTTPYYADKVLEWIKSKVELEGGFFG